MWESILGIAGGLLTGGMEKDAADNAAAASIEAAKIAADAAKFRPYGVTTGFGTSFFDTENQTAGYTLDPALQAYRDQLLQMGTQALPTSMDPTANATNYYNQMQDMMAPQRAQQQKQLQQNLFGGGRLGMKLAGEGAGAGAGSGMVQPDVFGYNQAMAQQDQRMAYDARTRSMQELDQAINRGTGLFNTGFGVEELGMKNLDIGSALGAKQASAGGTQAQALLSGYNNAADANLAGSVGMADNVNAMIQQIISKMGQGG